MEGPSPLKKNWVLTQDAFDVLLARLDPDQVRAGRKYEDIRRALITFFECRGSSLPEEQADETINRVARRCLEGTEIQSENPAGYFYGVARNVLKEYWGSPGPAVVSLESIPPLKHLSEDPGRLHDLRAERHQTERRLECLEHCLEALGAQDRDLITAYYQGETDVKIRNRKLLAAKIGIGANALRIRALRIREKLEGCVGGCLNRPSGRMKHLLVIATV